MRPPRYRMPPIAPSNPSAQPQPWPQQASVPPSAPLPRGLLDVPVSPPRGLLDPAGFPPSFRNPAARSSTVGPARRAASRQRPHDVQGEDELLGGEGHDELGSVPDSGSPSGSNSYRGERRLPITAAERDMAAAGDVEGFWRARQAQGDPVAAIALSSLHPSGDLIDSLFGANPSMIGSRPSLASMQGIARTWTPSVPRS